MLEIIKVTELKKNSIHICCLLNSPLIKYDIVCTNKNKRDFFSLNKTFEYEKIFLIVNKNEDNLLMTYFELKKIFNNLYSLMKKKKDFEDYKDIYINESLYKKMNLDEFIATRHLKKLRFNKKPFIEIFIEERLKEELFLKKVKDYNLKVLSFLDNEIFKASEWFIKNNIPIEIVNYKFLI